MNFNTLVLLIYFKVASKWWVLVSTKTYSTIYKIKQLAFNSFQGLSISFSLELRLKLTLYLNGIARILDLVILWQSLWVVSDLKDRPPVLKKGIFLKRFFSLSIIPATQTARPSSSYALVSVGHTNICTVRGSNLRHAVQQTVAQPPRQPCRRYYTQYYLVLK